MSFFKKEERPQSHYTIPRFPIHPILDCITGEIVFGSKGDAITNGGMVPHMAINGKGNSNKTLLMISVFMKILINNLHPDFKYNVDTQIFETENTLEYMRVVQLLRGAITTLGISDEDETTIMEYFLDTFILRNSSTLDASAWANELDALSKERLKTGKKNKIQLPFADMFGKPVEVYIPHLCGLDSFSAFEPDVITQTYLDKNTAGSSENNIMYAKEAIAKTQLLQRWVNSNPRSSIYMISTAHMGDSINIDSRSPKEKILSFMKQNHKIKNVPEKYYFYVNVMFFINGSAPLVNSDKVPQYPEDSSDKEKADNKDLLLEAVVLRNKHGQSGAFLPLVINQNTGVDWDLTSYHFGRMKKWGFTGGDSSYVLDLYPECKLSRSVAKRKLREDAILRRAVNINCELYMMYRYMFDKVPRELRCTPEDLRNDLVELGYDWNNLLATTRGYYTLDHYEHPVPPLSTYDLLRMRVGQYIPYWMKEEDIPEKVKAIRDGQAAAKLSGNGDPTPQGEETSMMEAEEV